MNKKIKITISTMLAAAMLTIFAPISKADASVAWSTSDQYGSWSNGGYTFNNDVWGSGASGEYMWANTYSNWGVWTAQPNTGGVKSYPHVDKSINKTLSTVNTATSSFDVSVPTSGTSMETAYDIWLVDNNAYDPNYPNKNKHEIMLWMNEYGSVNPISYNYDASGPVPVYTNVSIGGQTWNVYRGNNGANNTGNMVYSFIRTNGNISSGSVDIKAIANWIKDTPKWYGDIEFSNISFGFEITSSYNGGNGYNFYTNSFSVTTN
jgi:hypothetical protein